MFSFSVQHLVMLSFALHNTNKILGGALLKHMLTVSTCCGSNRNW